MRLKSEQGWSNENLEKNRKALSDNEIMNDMSTNHFEMLVMRFLK